MNNKQIDWKIGDKFMIEDRHCEKYPTLYTKGKIYIVENLGIKKKPWFRDDENDLVHTNGEMIPIKQQENKIDIQPNDEHHSSQIQQKLEYMGLSSPAIDDIMKMVRDMSIASFENGVNVGKIEVKLGLEKFLK